MGIEKILLESSKNNAFKVKDIGFLLIKET